jgi:hypothetical protein
LEDLTMATVRDLVRMSALLVPWQFAGLAVLPVIPAKAGTHLNLSLEPGWVLAGARPFPGKLHDESRQNGKNDPETDATGQDGRKNEENGPPADRRAARVVPAGAGRGDAPGVFFSVGAAMPPPPVVVPPPVFFNLARRAPDSGDAPLRCQKTFLSARLLEPRP